MATLRAQFRSLGSCEGGGLCEVQELQPVPGKADRPWEGYVIHLWEEALRGHWGLPRH